MRTSFNISLPGPMKKWVEQEVHARGYPTADAFFLEILQREKALAARERVDDILEHAMSEGKPTPLTTATWDRIRAASRKLGKEKRKN